MLRFAFAILLIFPSVLSAGYLPRRNQQDGELPIWTPSAGQLSQLTATIPGMNIHKLPAGEYRFPDTVTVHEAIKTSLDLESLNLRVALLGCSEWPDRWSLPFDLSGKDKYPPIKNLILDGYAFGDDDFEDVRPPHGLPFWHTYAYEWDRWISSGNAWKWWQWRSLPETQRLKTNAELWADAMDWSRLETLELRDLSGSRFVKHISPSLTGLKELTLDGFLSDNTSALLINLPPLRKLVWLEGYAMEQTELDAVLERHGSTLEDLQLHRLLISSYAPFASTAQIRMISHMAPKLNNFAIAIERNGSWPLETLEAISRMPRLENVELWMQYISKEGFQTEHDYAYPGPYSREEGDENSTEYGFLYQKPLLDLSGVTELWEFMKKASSDRLKSVSFRAGDLTRAWDGPLNIPRWSEGAGVAWDCDSKGCRYPQHKRDVFMRQEFVDNDWQESILP